jgi:hypothetical protein
MKKWRIKRIYNLVRLSKDYDLHLSEEGDGKELKY